MEEDLCGYMDWITQAEDMDELDEDGNPRKTHTLTLTHTAPKGSGPFNQPLTSDLLTVDVSVFFWGNNGGNNGPTPP